MQKFYEFTFILGYVAGLMEEGEGKRRREQEEDGEKEGEEEVILTL